MNFNLIREVLEDAVSKLDPNDVAQRMSNIKLGRAPNGVMSRNEGDNVLFDWGGLPLVGVPVKDLEDEVLTVDDMTRIDVPDSAEEA